MNVILIVNDSFRRDHLGAYGNEWIRTPNLDEFARESALFERYYAGSYPTVPNRWDLVTGRFGFPFRGWQPLGPGDVTMAQMLSDAGVHTQMIWDTPMLGMHNYNYTRGFDGTCFVHGQKGDPWVTDPSLDISLPCAPHKILSVESLLTYLRNHHGRKYDREFCVGRTVASACEWLETNHTHDRFFLWLDMWDPHEPFDCPWYDLELYGDPSYAGEQMIYPEYGRPDYMSRSELKNARARYAGNISLVDRWMGTLFRTIEKLRLDRNTLVIWLSDHGHLFGEHDLQGKPGAELGTLYEETTHIPLLVRHPERLGAGKRIQGIVQPPDILPSILEYAGLPTPAELDGVSFWPLVQDPEKQGRSYSFTNRFPPAAGDGFYTPVEGVLFDGWKGSNNIVEPVTVTSNKWALIGNTAGRSDELYDLSGDPDQKNNVAGVEIDIVREMREAWIEFLESSDAPANRRRPFIEAEPQVGLPYDGELFVFYDSAGLGYGFATEEAAHAKCDHALFGGRPVKTIRTTFGELLNANDHSLIYLYGQYYWASDLAGAHPS